MDAKDVLATTERYVRETLEGEGSGHDWWHIHRVRQIALRLAQEEQADRFVVELAVLLHDIEDWKSHGPEQGAAHARNWLAGKVDDEVIHSVCEIIRTMSFKGAGEPVGMATKEGMVVQDADRLDAIGAIGIARTFAYGGHKGRILYDPETPPKPDQSAAEYASGTAPTINHFYEKLLLLRDRMNTESAKRVASERHDYMQQYLNRFYKEWDGQL